MSDSAPAHDGRDSARGAAIEPFTARSGAPSLRIGGASLHSPYDPAREAARFVEGALAGETPSTVVILGEGLGYLTDALARRLPGARLLRVFYSEQVHSLSPRRDCLSWHPEAAGSLEEFLRQNIGELDMEGLRPMEWQPSAAAFPAASRAAHMALRQVLQELNGSLVTTLAAGRLWIRNTVENFVCLDGPVTGRPCPQGRAVLVAASGPSLEKALPAVRESRQLMELWALPSSVPFLGSAGLRPDLVVMTDPSHWSMLHLHFAGAGCPVALPLSAARGLWRLGGAAPFLLCQPSFFEQELLAAAGRVGASAPRIAPHGTVAATAIDLALASTDGPVVAAGMDMRAEDLATHCRPNAFEDYLRGAELRTAPLYGQLFARAAAQEVERVREEGRSVRHLRALRTYAGWFAEPSPLDRGRLFRLLPTPVPLPRLRDLDPRDLPGLLAGGSAAGRAAAGSLPPGLRPDPSWPDRRARALIASRALSRWNEAVDSGQGALGAGGGLEAFSRSPLLLPLAYHVDARSLLDARRRARAGDTAGAIEASTQALDNCARFLAFLEAKIGAA
jgi:hypothetical protein